MRCRILVFSFLVLAFAACGDDAVDTTSAATTPETVATTTTTLPTTTTTTTLPPTTITAAVAQNEYAGQWVGETSQGERIAFAIGDDGGVLDFSMAFSGTQYDHLSPLRVSYGTPVVFVTGDVIDWLIGGVGDVEVEGQFDSAESASGTARIDAAALTVDWSASLVAP